MAYRGIGVSVDKPVLSICPVGWAILYIHLFESDEETELN